MSVAFSELKTEEYVPGRPVVYYFEPPLREASRAKAEDLKWVMEISLSTLENPPEVYEALDATDAYRKMQESLGLSQNQEKVTVTNSEVVSVTPEDEPTILKSISVPEFVDPPVKKHKKNPDRDGHSLGRKRKTKAIVALRSKRKQVAKTVEAFAEVGELAQTMISKIESGQYVRPMYWQKWCLKAGVAEDTYIQIMHDNHLPVRMSNNKATQNSWVETPLIALRKSIGLSRQKVSKDMGISERHLRNAELGRECPESVREIVRKWYKIKPEDYKEMGIQTQIEAIDVGAEKRVLA